MILTVVVNVFNIVGNLVFVYGFGMNSNGVAYSTLCAQYLGLLITFRILTTLASPLHQSVNWHHVLLLLALRRYFSINLDLFLRTLNLIVVFAFFTLASSWQGSLILAANSILDSYNYEDGDLRLRESGQWIRAHAIFCTRPDSY